MPKNQDQKSGRSQPDQPARTDPATDDAIDETMGEDTRDGVPRTSGDVDAPQPEHQRDR